MDELPSITECSTASIESGSENMENTYDNHSEKSFIPVYKYKNITFRTPSAPKTLSFPEENDKYFTSQRKTFLEIHAPRNELSVKVTAFKKAVEHDKEHSRIIKDHLIQRESFDISNMSAKDACSSLLPLNSIWTIFGLKWVIEMSNGKVPKVPSFTFSLYGGIPDGTGGINSFLRCEEFIVYMKAMYGDKALSLLKKKG